MVATESEIDPDVPLIWQLKWRVTDWRRTYTDNPPAQPNDPTPEEIAEQTAVIRAKWDAATEASRRTIEPTQNVEITTSDDSEFNIRRDAEW